jgi:hypothetical protein
MAPRRLLIALFCFAPLLAHAVIDEPAPGPSLAERAEASTALIHDAPAFIAEVEVTVEMARDGEYGRLKRGGLVRIQRARDVIVGLLTGHASATELTPDDRIAVFNAQEQISAELNDDDKNRTVCKREATLGTRFPTTECLTVAERESRRRISRESTDKLFRNVCFAGEGSACGSK